MDSESLVHLETLVPERQRATSFGKIEPDITYPSSPVTCGRLEATTIVHYLDGPTDAVVTGIWKRKFEKSTGSLAQRERRARRPLNVERGKDGNFLLAGKEWISADANAIKKRVGTRTTLSCKLARRSRTSLGRNEGTRTFAIDSTRHAFLTPS